MAEINLLDWCAREEDYRPYISKPWTRSGFTWATNGSALVRVCARDHILDVPGAPNGKSVVPVDIDTRPMSPLRMALPEPRAARKDRKCFQCDGTGSTAPCGCKCIKCECPECGGKGRVYSRDDARQPVLLRGQIFDAQYLRLVASLPGLQCDLQAGNASPMCFRFDGGVALIMPMEWAPGGPFENCEVA